ncbi:unnamed protein product [Gordionus sp. m RMFG-2023]
MALNTCGIIVKYLLFVVNFVLFAGGLTILTLAIIAITTNMNMKAILGSNLYSSSAYILIAASLLIIIISYLGCFGTYKELRSMLIIYTIILFVLFLVMLIGAIVGYAFNSKFQDATRNKMIDVAQNNYGVNQFWTTVWDSLQQELKCCGIDGKTIPSGYGIWQNSMWYRSKSQAEKINRIPLSCCNANAGIEQKTLCQNLEAIGMDYFYTDVTFTF